MLVTLPQWTDLASIQSRCRVRLASLVFTLVPPPLPTAAQIAAATAAVAAAAAAVAAAVAAAAAAALAVPVPPSPPPAIVAPAVVPAAPAAAFFGLRCRTELRVRHYPFTLVTSAHRNNTARKLDEKFRDHFDLAADYFPLQEALPRLYYVSDEVEPDDPHWELELPRNTMFVTSDPHFWAGIGFSGGSKPYSAAWSRVMKIGGRQKKEVHVLCHGFANSVSTGGTMVIRGEKMYSGQSLSLNLPPDAVVASSMQFQLEVLKVAAQALELPGQRQVTPDEVVVGLTALLEEAREACGLSSLPLDARLGPRGSVQIVSETHAGSKTKMILILDDEMSAGLNHPPNLPLIFDFEAPGRTLTLRLERELAAPGGGGGGALLPPPPQQPVVLAPPLPPPPAPPQRTTGTWDPFRGKYPILVVLRGHGVSRSFVRGRGYLTLLGRVEERRGALPADGVGLEMTASETYLSVQFLDCNRSLVVFDRDLTANFVFDFTRVTL